MKLIVITNEVIFEKDGLIINHFFDEGLETLHLRKPLAKESELIYLLNQIEPKYHTRIVLHDHFTLLKSYNLKGIHLNRRNNVNHLIETASISCSCHSFESIEAYINNYDYMFLSPIFDSISKKGYKHAFSEEQLAEAEASCIINEKVIALGGISKETIPLAAQYGFGGVAALGSIWGNYFQDRNEYALLKRFENLLTITEKL